MVPGTIFPLKKKKRERKNAVNYCQAARSLTVISCLKAELTFKENYQASPFWKGALCFGCACRLRVAFEREPCQNRTSRSEWYSIFCIEQAVFLGIKRTVM